MADSVFENIQVIVRARPLNKQEKGRGEDIVVEVRPGVSEVWVKPSPVQLAMMAGAAKSGFDSPFGRRFTFDRTFDGNSTQEALFESSVAPIVDEVLRGFSCTLFCYGQTGTGKTFTMEGKKREDGALDADGPDAGMIARSVRKVFNHLNATASDSHVKISFLELYNERLDDLLAAEPSTFMTGEGAGPSMGIGAAKAGAGAGGGRLQLVPASAADSAAAAGADDRDSKLKIVEEKTKTGSTIKVQNLEEVPVKSAEDVFHHLSRGFAKRATAETACNAQSSRSHCVFTLTITTREIDAASGEEVIRVGKLNLVDLAGSESIGRSGAKDARAREAGNINQSLLTLGRVITALVDHLPHIPYRDSKLTRLLQDSLGGRTKTCIIATLSPAAGCVEESLSTLEYANRAKKIQNKPEANAKVEKKALLKEMNGQVASLQALLALQQAKNGGVFMPTEEHQAMLAEIKALKYEVEEYKGTSATQEKEITALKENIDILERDLENWQAQAEQRAKELQETCEQLEATKETLVEEQVSHHESKAVIFSRDLHQQKLAKQTLTMAETLRTTVDDVNLLHGKVARANAVFASNRAAVSGYVSSLSGKLGLLMNDSAVHVASQVQALEGVSKALAGMQERCSKESSEMAAGVRKLQGDLAVYTKAVGQAASGVENEVGRQCGSAAEGSVARLAAIKEEQLVALAKAVEGALGSITAMLSSHGQLISSWSSSAASSLGECKATLATFAAEQGDALQAIRKGIEDQEAETQAALYHQKQAMQRLLAERNEATQKATEGMIASVSAALRQFSADSQKENEAGFTGLLGKVQETSQASRKAALAANAGIGAVATRLDQFNGKMTAAIAGSLEQNQSSYDKAAKGQEDMAAFASTSLGKEIPASISSIQASVAKASEATAHDLSSIKGTVAAYSSRAQVASASAQDRFSKASDLLSTQGERIAAGVAAVVSPAVDGIQSTVIPKEKHFFAGEEQSGNGSGGSIRSWVGDVACLSAATFTSSTSTVKELAATGATPAKRDYKAPETSSLVVFDEENKGTEVRSRFRATVAAASTTEGPAQAASALFASPMKTRLAGIAAVPATPAAAVVAPSSSLVTGSGSGCSVQITREASAALEQIVRECADANATPRPVVAAPAPVVAVASVSLEQQEQEQEQDEEKQVEQEPALSPASSLSSPKVASPAIEAAPAIVPAPAPAVEEEQEQEAEEAVSPTATSSDAALNALAGISISNNSTNSSPEVVAAAAEEDEDEEVAQPAGVATVTAATAITTTGASTTTATATGTGASRRTRQVAAMTTTSATSSLTKSGRLVSSLSSASLAAPAAAPAAAAAVTTSASGRVRRVIGVAPPTSIGPAAAAVASSTAAVPTPSAAASVPAAPAASAATATATAAPALKVRASIAGKDGAKISLGIGAAAKIAAAASTGSSSLSAAGAGSSENAVAPPAVALASTTKAAVRVASTSTSASSAAAATGTRTARLAGTLSGGGSHNE